MDYQIYAMSDSGKCNHAGVYRLGKFSIRTIRKLERKWMVWRQEYIKTHLGDYPLRYDRLISNYIIVFPVAMPSNARYFKI